MKKYRLLELIAELFQNKNEIRSTSISYRHEETGDKSASMIIITKDEDVFEVKVRKI